MGRQPTGAQESPMKGRNEVPGPPPGRSTDYGVTALAPVFKLSQLSDERWHRHWRDVHGPMAARISLLTRYVQIHRVAPTLQGFQSYGCIGLVDVAFATAADAASLASDPDYLSGAHLDEANFLDRERSVTYLTRKEVLIQATERDGTGRAVLLLSKHPALSGDDWHADCLQGFRHAAKLQQIESHALEEPHAAPVDAIAILCWRDVSALERAWRTTAVQNAITDLGRVVDMAASYGFMGHAHQVI
jgi:hypothetical protein